MVQLNEVFEFEENIVKMCLSEVRHFYIVARKFKDEIRRITSIFQILNGINN